MYEYEYCKNTNIATNKMFKLILNAPIPAGCSQALEDQGQVPLEAPEDNNICQIAIFLKAQRLFAFIHCSPRGKNNSAKNSWAAIAVPLNELRVILLVNMQELCVSNQTMKRFNTWPNLQVVNLLFIMFHIHLSKIVCRQHFLRLKKHSL